MAKRPYISTIKTNTPDGLKQYHVKDRDGRVLLAGYYEANTAYPVGSYVLHDKVEGSGDGSVSLYRVKQAITSGENTGWSAISSKLDTVSITELIENKVQKASSATDNAIVRFDGTSGKQIQNSSITIDDNGNLKLPANASIRFNNNDQMTLRGANNGFFSSMNILPSTNNDKSLGSSEYKWENLYLGDGPGQINGNITLPNTTNNVTLATTTEVSTAENNAKSYADSLISGLGNVLTFKGTKTSSSAILAITQAKKGDVWIATDNGSEWVCTEDITSAKASAWERFGTTDVSGALYKDNNIFTDSYILLADGTDGKVKAVSGLYGMGAVTVEGNVTGMTFNGLPSPVTVTGNQTTYTPIKKYLTASASGTELTVTANTEVNKGYNANKKYLHKTNITPIASTGSEITYGTANVGSSKDVGTGLGGDTTFAKSGLASASLTGTTTFNTNAIKSASLTGDTTFAKAGLSAVYFTPDANDDECLLLTGTAATTGTVGISTTAADTGTVEISTTAAATGTVTLTKEAITPAVESTSKFTLYGQGTSIDVYTSLNDTAAGGEAVAVDVTTTGTITPVTAVTVKTQPSITLTSNAESTTGSVAYVTDLTPSTGSITLSGSVVPNGTVTGGTVESEGTVSVTVGDAAVVTSNTGGSDTY